MTNGKEGTPSLIAWAAIAILAGFAWLTWYVTRNIGLVEPQWTRLTYVYAGSEAVVFAAAGALFGTTVQRSRADAAEKRAAKAESKAEEGSADAEVARALEAQLRALQGRHQQAGKPLQQQALSTERIQGSVQASAPRDEPTGDVVGDLLRLAEELRASLAIDDASRS